MRKFWVINLVMIALSTVKIEAQQLRSLKTVAVPQPPGLDRYVRDQPALVALGKAFFWDMQVGSDGRTACASCHFHAGADHRAQNQLANPLGQFPLNRLLSPAEFPFRRFSDPGNRNSTVLSDNASRVGSAGLFRRAFIDIVPGQAAEIGGELLDKQEFMRDGLLVRRVTNRNTPTVINSVFTVLNFWDGRANRIFNGFTPGGANAETPGVLLARNGLVERELVRLDNSSLASQAVGPAMDQLEMSYEGRTWPKLGKKMLSLTPLGLQRVASDDSVLGSMANSEGPGLASGVSYESLIRQAFQPAYWESDQLFDGNGEAIAGRRGLAANTSEFTQAEYNFPLFWGLALQAYQATLVSSDSRVDQFFDGDAGALSAQEQEGMRIFQTTGRCTTCHGGAETTAASFSSQGGRGNRAFQWTGVRPIAEDVARGNGAFKSSSLRNIELTGPYFHNGGTATLEQLVDFYARGGDFGGNNNIRSFNVNSSQKAALVAFLKALTDDRVKYSRAPFDHPELCVPTGHVESQSGLLIPAGHAMFPQSAAEKWSGLAAVGAGGLGVPLQTFEEMLNGTGRDGSRANALTGGCAISLP